MPRQLIFIGLERGNVSLCSPWLPDDPAGLSLAQPVPLPSRRRPPAGAARGLQFSLSNIPQHLLLQRQISNQLLQPAVLLLKLLEPLGLVNVKAAVLLSPSVKALLRRSDLLAGRCQALALALQNLDLPQLRDNLLST